MKQTGVENDAFLNATELKTLKDNLDATLKFYYFMLLVGSELVPSRVFSSVSMTTKSNLFDAQNVIKLLKESKIDVKAIYESAAPEKAALQSIADLFKVVENQTTFPLLEVGRPTLETDTIHNADYYADKISRNDYSGYQLINILSFADNRAFNTSFFVEFHYHFRYILQSFEHRIELLNKLLDQKPGMPDGEYLPFKDDRFPIIFVVEDEDKLGLFNLLAGEFRANAPMVLGEDIHIIATDNEENRGKVQSFLKYQGLEDKVTALTYDELQASANQEHALEDPKFKTCDIHFTKNHSPSHDRMKIIDIFHDALAFNSSLRKKFKTDKDQERQFVVASTAFKYALLKELELGNDQYALKNAEAFAALNQPNVDLLTLLPLFKDALFYQEPNVPVEPYTRSAGAVCLNLLIGALIGLAIVGILLLASVPFSWVVAASVVAVCLTLGAIGGELYGQCSAQQPPLPRTHKESSERGMNVYAFFSPKSEPEEIPAPEDFLNIPAAV